MFRRLDLQSRKNVFVALSGGIDSTILLYLLTKNYSKIHTLIPFTIDREQRNCVNGIVNFINSKLDSNISKPFTYGDKTLPHHKIVGDTIKKLCGSPHVDFIIIGENKVFDETIPGAPVRLPHNNHKKVIAPFLDLTKDAIISMYIEHDLIGLLALTWSCTEQSNIECGQCYQCLEKSWA